ncbi:MAG: GGDEF domain-containing protein, partial [Pseudomonadota bacterium]
MDRGQAAEAVERSRLDGRGADAVAAGGTRGDDGFQRVIDQRLKVQVCRAQVRHADAVLQQVVHDTAPTLRGADALALFAEGQLAVFLAHADATGALDVAERIRERTELLDTSADGRRLRSTVSVGVAHLRPAHLHLQALIDDALEAVVAARTAGGNCVRAAPVE